jgi:hypothetical protein
MADGLRFRAAFLPRSRIIALLLLAYNVLCWVLEVSTALKNLFRRYPIGLIDCGHLIMGAHTVATTFG